MLKISVVIPSYNQGQYLEQTIQSVLSQEYPLLELFVIDGGSKDNSVAVIRKYENKLNGWISEKDKGQSHAINKGFSRCTGDIMTWLCSDDLYTPGTLHEVNRLFSSLPASTGLIYGSSVIFNEKKDLRTDSGCKDQSAERKLAGIAFPQASSFFRSSVYKKAGPVNEQLHYGMDYDLFSRMSVICDFHFAGKTFSRYRLHENSKSTSAVKGFTDEWIIIFNSIAEGLGLTFCASELKSIGLPDDTLPEIVIYFKNHKPSKITDQNKLLFDVLCNIIRFDYESGRFKRSAVIAAYLKNNFSASLSAEPTVKRITRFAHYSPWMLLMARRITRKLFYS